MDLLTVSGLGSKEKGIYTARDISFVQQAGQKIAVAGETGSGKTTLLKMIAGLLQADEGEILFEQQKLRGPFDQLIPGHAGIAYLSQHFELRNNYWVHEILSYANELPEDKAFELYRICRIDHLLNRRTDQLSGGERQRIALARLLIGMPRLLLLDEPFSNLDTMHKNIIKAVISDVNTQIGTSCIMVSHDAADTLSWADRILVLKDGKLIQQDNPENIYFKPVDAYCAGLFGDYTLVDTENASKLQPGREVPGGKKLIVRPEQFIIGGNAGGLVGTILNKTFMGSYYMLGVTAGSQMLFVRTTDPSCKAGTNIRLHLRNDAAWYV